MWRIYLLLKLEIFMVIRISRLQTFLITRGRGIGRINVRVREKDTWNLQQKKICYNESNSEKVKKNVKFTRCLHDDLSSFFFFDSYLDSFLLVFSSLDRHWVQVNMCNLWTKLTDFTWNAIHHRISFCHTWLSFFGVFHNDKGRNTIECINSRKKKFIPLKSIVKISKQTSSIHSRVDQSSPITNF